MAEWFRELIIIGMFTLRSALLLAIMVAVGYCLRRLDANWQAKAKARRRETGLARKGD